MTIVRNQFSAIAKYDPQIADELRRGTAAFERLLVRLEADRSQQTERLAKIMVAFYDWTAYDLPTRFLGTFERQVEDDLIAVHSAFRHEHYLYEGIANGAARTRAALQRFGVLDEPIEP